MPHHVMVVRLHARPPHASPRRTAPARFRQVRLHGACQQQVSTLIAFLHCDLVRKTFVAKLGVRLQIRAKSLYQLFEVIQFLKLLNPIVSKGSVFIWANPSGDCPRAERYFSELHARTSTTQHAWGSMHTHRA
jgi:hypothetical protein